MNPTLALILANIIWGAGAPIFKLTLTNIPPFTLAFLRFFLAGVILLPLTIGYWQKIKIKDFFRLFVGALFGISIHIPLYFLALQKTASINAPIIMSSAPVFLFFLSVTFLKEKPKKKVFSGMMIGLLGVLVVILSPFFIKGGQLTFGQIEGNILLVLSTFGLIVHTLIHKKLLDKLNFQIVNFWTMILGSLPLVPFVFAETRTWSFSQINLVGSLGLIYGIFFTSALAYSFFHFGLSKISAEEIGIFTYIDPVAAVVLAGPLLGEHPTFFFLLGSFLVFWGIFIAEGRIHWHPLHKLGLKW